MKKFEIELTFTEAVLGTVPKDKEIYSKFVQSKAENPNGVDDELETIVELDEKGYTGFHMVNVVEGEGGTGFPAIYNYAVKGFFKDACSMLRRVPKTKSKKLTAHKKVIDGLIFVNPRLIPIELHGKEMGVLERPLRASTPKGDRVTLTKSDSCPPGSTMKFIVTILGGVSDDLLVEWLDYGHMRGLGQWRNGGYGCFWYEIKAIK